MLFALALACAPPFDQTRKDLRDFRLVGMSARDGALHALVWSGEGAFHSTAPTVTWTVDDVEVTGAPAAPFTARVRVESADGAYEEGELVVEEGATNPAIAGFSRDVADGTAALAVEADLGYTRWKASSGTFVESGANSTDWTREDAPLTAVVALTLDGKGGVTWTWIDVATDAGPYLAVGGRLLPVDAAVAEAGTFDATITPADTLAGYVLTDLTPAAEDDTVEIVCGVDPFDPDVLADGRCGLDEAAGARVRLTGAPWP